MRDKRKRETLYAGHSGLIRLAYSVSTVIDRFQAAKKQSEPFQQFIPRRVQQTGPSASRPVINSRREEQKASVAVHIHLHKDWQSGYHTQSQPTEGRPNLRMVFDAQAAKGKKT